MKFETILAKAQVTAKKNEVDIVTDEIADQQLIAQILEFVSENELVDCKVTVGKVAQPLATKAKIIKLVADQNGMRANMVVCPKTTDGYLQLVKAVIDEMTIEFDLKDGMF